MSAAGPHSGPVNPIHPSVLPRLDPAFVDLYNEHIANVPNKPPDLQFMRANYSKMYAYGTAPAPEVGKVWDAVVPGHGEGVEIAVRIYVPLSPGPWPVHLDFHGGGWALGDLDTESHICRHICQKASAAVIDVEYRLVPEHPFPTSILDSFAALKYVYAQGEEKFNIDPSRISLGGVSAGGNIALVLAHLARDEGIPLKLVAAGTPVIDDISNLESPDDSPFPSVREMALAPTLNWPRLKYFDDVKWSSLSAGPEARDEKIKALGWYANPMSALNFKGLPKTLVYTAGCDPLRDEGEAYARKLVEGGTEVTLKRFEGVPHPFMHMDEALWQARDFIRMTTKEIRLALHDD